MRSNIPLQLISSLLCVLFALAFLNPFHYLMTDHAHMIILGLLAAAFGTLAILILLERGDDERELSHRALAGRAGFLTGSSVLLLAVIWQAFHGPVDPWLIIALCGMVTAKAFARWYSRLYQ